MKNTSRIKVRELLKQLREWSQGREPAGHEINTLLKILSDVEDMNVDQLFARMQRSSGSANSEAVNKAVSSLQSAFPDDDAFGAAIEVMTADKSITKAALVEVFYKLFDRTRGVPKKATRTELLRLIADERRIIVRNEKMGQMLGRRIVAAE